MTLSNAQLESVFQEAIAAAATALTAELLRTAPQMLAQQRMDQFTFEERLFEHWGKALDLFQTTLVVAREAGESFNEQQRPRAAKEQDFMFEVLTRLHARACLTASEVGVLLRSGYADAAMSRWRTLHEITVVASFIKQHGGETAERYLLHEIVESCKAAEQYERYRERLGFDPLTPDELPRLRAQREGLRERFGEAFDRDYGWAAEALDGHSPNISEIEQAVGLDHMRPYYRMASYGVHSNPKGIKFSLGLGNHPSQMILLAGPSNAGLCDPGHATVISLTNCTVTLLTQIPTFDALVICQTLLELTEATGLAFLDAHITMEAMIAAPPQTDNL